MSPARRSFTNAIRLKDWAGAYKNLNGLNMHEMLWALASMPRITLEDLWNQRALFASAVNLTRIEYAMIVVRNRKLPPAAPGDLQQTGQVKEAQNFLSGKREHQLIITEDPTGLLPTPNPKAPRLAPSDFDAAAQALDIEAAAIHAVADVESGGRTGFDNQGRPKILFEAHIFSKQTGAKFTISHPHLSQPNWNAGKKYYSWDQWSRLFEAMTLDSEAAWKSASWGMFQVMGFNHSGWGKIGGFVDAMFESEFMHLKSFLAYCQQGNLIRHLKDKNWAAFALGYNGKGYAENHYHTKMATAYQKYSKAVAPTQAGDNKPAASTVQPVMIA